MEYCINIAGLYIQITGLHEYTKVLSKAFLTDCSHPEIRLTITDEDIENERSHSNFNKSDGYWESLAIYRKIADSVLLYDTFLMHGSVICVNNLAYMVTAQSGVGKTTRANTWLRIIPESHILNGDKPLLQIHDDKVLACGTPWCGKENIGTNEILPLKAIFFLERSDLNQVTELTFSEAFLPLLKQTYRPDSAEKMKKTLELLKELKGKVRFFRFQSNLEDEAVRMAYAAATSDDPKS